MAGFGDAPSPSDRSVIVPRFHFSLRLDPVRSALRYFE